MTAEELFQYFDFENRQYYYHIAEKGVGEHILEEGLAMADQHIWSAMIEITPDLISDVPEFLANECDHGLRKTEEMVLIAIDKGNEKYLVKHNDDGREFSWTESQNVPYYVPESNVLGYIDLIDPSYPFRANSHCFAYELEDILPYSY